MGDSTTSQFYNIELGLNSFLNMVSESILVMLISISLFNMILESILVMFISIIDKVNSYYINEYKHYLTR